MSKEYLSKIFEIFKKAYGINDTFDNFSKYTDLFEDWIIKKDIAAANYVQLFDYLKEEYDADTNIMAEFGKGNYDTVAIKMANNTKYQPIIISPYAETIKNNKEVEIYTGELGVYKGEAIVKYPTKEELITNPNCNRILNDEIDTLITQIPLSREELHPFLQLLDSPKTLFIGTYGSLHDKDAKENIARIAYFYQRISDVSHRDVNFCSETIDDSYISAIKISSKVKTKEKNNY